MQPDFWQKAKEIFHAALELRPAERARFLDEACNDQVSLRKQVDSLIAAHEKEGSFMDSPAYEAATEMLIDDPEFKSGQMIGHYEILSTLGRGGMGEVYLARDTKLGRKVALKFLPSDFTRDAERLQRFDQEARSASALNHPSIITIYEIGEVHGRHFIATEFIDGKTLRQRSIDEPLKFAEALTIAEQIGSALAEAHAAGIVHRDIKPENIMLRHDGLVKVLDFGLAKLTEQQDSGPEDPTRALVKTGTGIVMGTTAYMSPEQARGLHVDARTDIWSFGVVLYEMVAGRAPFIGPTSGDLIAQILEREPPELSALKPDAPLELQQILKRALCKDREKRYQTTSELLTDLRSLKLALDLGVHSRSQAQPWFGTASRKKSVALIALSLLLLVSATFAVYKIISGRRQKASRLAQTPLVLTTTQITSGSGIDGFPSLSPDGNAVAFSSGRNGKFEIYVSQLTPGSRRFQTFRCDPN